MTDRDLDDKGVGAKPNRVLQNRRTSVGYEEMRQPLGAPNGGGPEARLEAGSASKANFDLSDPDAATRLGSVAPDGSINDGIVIASSSIHKLEEQDLPLTSASHDEPAEPSEVSVRDQERNRVRILVTYLDTKELHYPDTRSISIGRDATSHLRLIDPKVSRNHARIEPTVGGQRIVDVGAGNGLRINGRRKRSAELFDGDVIQIGDSTLEYNTIGWSRERHQQAAEAGIMGWARVFSLLGKQDRLRLSIYALSLSFLASGFVFLLMSFLSNSTTTTNEQRVLTYRRQAEKRAMVGDLAGALRSLDKVAFLTDALTETDLKKRKRWQTQMKEERAYRTIEVQALADPMPEELDELINQIQIDKSTYGKAARQVSQAKLSYLDRKIRGQKLSIDEENRLRTIYDSIDPKLVDGKRFENVSRRLFSKGD